MAGWRWEAAAGRQLDRLPACLCWLGCSLAELRLNKGAKARLALLQVLSDGLRQRGSERDRGE